MTTSFHRYSEVINDEIAEVLSAVAAKDIERFVSELQAAEKVFLVAVGRVLLSLHCFGKRLAHLGLSVEILGGITEKAMTERDLLVVASGSGESVLPVTIAKKAKHLNARVALITSSGSSTISDLADAVVRLPCPTKLDADRGVKSIQPMSTLFDQSLHIFGDAVSMMIMDGMNTPKEELWRFHANLE